MTLRRRRHATARHTRAAVALAAGAVALAACGGSGGSDDVPVAAPADASAPAPPAGADEAPDTTVDDAAVFASLFASTTPIDAEFDGASLAGRDSVLWFWAPWCTSCRAEAPDINETVARFGDDVQIIGVAGRGGIDEMRGFIDDTETTGFTHVADVDGDVWNAFGIYAQPAFVFINDNGEIETFIGGLGADHLAERIEELLAT